MGSLAAPELFVGGFTQVWLDVPVLSVTDLDDERARAAVTFFLAACLARSTPIARIDGVDGPRAALLVAALEETFAGALRSIDGENAGLMGYFDAYLAAPAEVANAAGDRIVERLTQALRS